jgi:hypothetical protein
MAYNFIAVSTDLPVYFPDTLWPNETRVIFLSNAQQREELSISTL